MHKGLIIPFAAGLGIIAIVVAGILYMQRGAHLAPAGSIQKVRTQPMDENSSVAVIDFRIENGSDYGLIVRQVSVTMEAKDGKIYEGAVASAVDTRNLFQYFPLLGQQYNDTMVSRDKIQPHQKIDRMVAARFGFPEKQLEDRRKLTVIVEDVDGPAAVITEK